MTILSLEGDVALLTFDRPGKHNALDRATWIALGEAIQRIGAEPSIKVVILRGAGGAFAAGADIAEFDSVFANREAALSHLKLMGDVTAALEALDQPTLAAIEGPCIGAGTAVALACDIRIAAVSARMAVTPAKLGLIYSLADTRRLTQTVGYAMAKDLLFTGRTIETDEALACGLIDFVVSADRLDRAVRAKASDIAAQSQFSIRTAKAVLRRVSSGQISDDDVTRGWFVDAVDGPDYREGLAAFRARRAPAFPFL